MALTTPCRLPAGIHGTVGWETSKRSPTNCYFQTPRAATAPRNFCAALQTSSGTRLVEPSYQLPSSAHSNAPKTNQVLRRPCCGYVGGVPGSTSPVSKRTVGGVAMKPAFRILLVRARRTVNGQELGILCLLEASLICAPAFRRRCWRRGEGPCHFICVPPEYGRRGEATSPIIFMPSGRPRSIKVWVFPNRNENNQVCIARHGAHHASAQALLQKCTQFCSSFFCSICR